MILTKEKIVFAAALLVAVSSATHIHVPRVEPAPGVPPEAQPRASTHEVVPVPALHPDRPIDPSARDPFVPTSAWVAATPAALGLPPSLPLPRALPGGAPPGMRGPLVVLPDEPRAVEEEDPK